MGLHLVKKVAASGADGYKVITEEPVPWGTRNAFTMEVVCLSVFLNTELLLTKDYLVIKEKTSVLDPEFSFTLIEIAYNRVYCHINAVSVPI